MIHFVRQVLEGLALGGTCAGVAYYLLCLWCAREYLRYRKAAFAAGSPGAQVEQRPVSILKPLKSADPGMYETFRTYCLQDYREYEIIFGVSEADDPALPFVQRLQQDFPEVSIQLVVCSENMGANTKVSNLVQMLRAARHEIVIVGDSDIRVESSYLRRVVAPLADANVGMVTCLYRGIANATLGSKLESVGISTDFAAGVMVARVIEGGVRFGLGSTLALRRCDLENMGGFDALVDHLADDYELGRGIAKQGLEVRLSEEVVETFLPAYTLREYFAHQLRWARAVRDSRRGGYLGLVLTFGLPWALLLVLASGGVWWSWSLLVVTAFLRTCVAVAVGNTVLGDPQALRFIPLIPLRDFVAVIVWLSSFGGNTISWRGSSFRVKDGKLIRSSPEG